MQATLCTAPTTMPGCHKQSAPVSAHHSTLRCHSAVSQQAGAVSSPVDAACDHLKSGLGGILLAEEEQCKAQAHKLRPGLAELLWRPRHQSLQQQPGIWLTETLTGTYGKPRRHSLLSYTPHATITFMLLVQDADVL